MPGYTHLQRAQPVRWSHWLMSHAWFLWADHDALERMMPTTPPPYSEGASDVCPLGSGALAGNPFSVDRRCMAADMGFAGGVTVNR